VIQAVDTQGFLWWNPKVLRSAKYRYTGIDGVEIRMTRAMKLPDGKVVFQLVVAEANVNFTDR
jgi:hypothetical protein